MKRQRVTRHPETGRTMVVYEDCGPQKVLPAHGRPVQKASPQAAWNGVRQIRLGAGQ